MIRPKLLTVTGDGDLYIGEEEFPEAGTFTWDVPLSVRYIHVCAIGAGPDYLPCLACSPALPTCGEPKRICAKADCIVSAGPDH